MSLAGYCWFQDRLSGRLALTLGDRVWGERCWRCIRRRARYQVMHTLCGLVFQPLAPSVKILKVPLHSGHVASCVFLASEC